MRQRVISAMVALALLFIILASFNTMFFNIAIIVLSIVAVFEFFHTTKCAQFMPLKLYAVINVIIIAFAQEKKQILPLLVFFDVLFLFIILLIYHEKVKTSDIALTFFFSMFVPAFFSCAIYIRNLCDWRIAIFYVFWALACGWLCDTGAYFTGLKFGRHKMAPLISPKKTVEGAVGGLVTSTLGMLILVLIYKQIMLSFGINLEVKYVMVLLCTPVISLIGMLGDLFASIIKRQYGVKDYGNIMPGHGGIMDRCDSVLFTLPSMFILVSAADLLVIV